MYCKITLKLIQCTQWQKIILPTNVAEEKPTVIGQTERMVSGTRRNRSRRFERVALETQMMQQRIPSSTLFKGSRKLSEFSLEEDISSNELR